MVMVEKYLEMDIAIIMDAAMLEEILIIGIIGEVMIMMAVILVEIAMIVLVAGMDVEEMNMQRMVVV